MNIERPAVETVPEYFRKYLEAAQGDELIQALQKASDSVWRTVRRIPTGGDELRYAEDKWTIGGVFQHVIDTERIFSYRALTFARGDTTEQPGFDENAYGRIAAETKRSFHHILREHDTVRAGTIELFRSFDEAALERSGIASGKKLSTVVLGWLIAGHAEHHMTVVEQRYLGLDAK